MDNQDVKKKLIETTKNLLTSGTEVRAITARQISLEAGTNLAMINYYFKSKDELVKISVDEIISEEFYNNPRVDDTNMTAKEQLKQRLIDVTHAMIKYRELTKLSIPYMMLQDDITLPLEILPFITTHFGTQKSITECKIIAFQIIYTLQLIFYRAEDFYKYSGLNIRDEQQVDDFINSQLDQFLG